MPVRELSGKDYDRFIIDAPCSGTGTWRRSPDAKFRLTPEKLNELTKIQSQLLEFALENTKVGGRIVYITCSILPDEDENIVSAFAQRHKNVRYVDLKQLWQQKIDAPYPAKNTEFLRFSPLLTNTDGFFLAIFEKMA